MIESRATAVRYRSSLVIGFAISAMLVAPSSGATRAVHLRCRDGLLTPVASERVCSPGDLTGPCRPACDSDGVCDGLCTFVTTVCDDRGCAPHAFVVHAGRRKKFRLVTAVGMKP